MSTKTTGRFTPTGWDESVIEDIDGVGETKNGTYYPSRGVTTAKVTFQYTGDIAGTSATTYLFAYRDSKAGHADILGYERFTGTVGGREGSCVFRHTGSYEDGAVTARVEVLPGLGTDGLADLSGTADISMAGPPPEGGYEFTLTRV